MVSDEHIAKVRLYVVRQVLQSRGLGFAHLVLEFPWKQVDLILREELLGHIAN